MPEGPSLVIFKEEIMPFKGKKVLTASGDVKTMDPGLLKGKKIKDIKTWGKHLLLIFSDDLTVRIHFLMFGSFTIDSKKDRPARLHLGFAGKRELNFYTCSIQLIEQPLDEAYDWTADIMNPDWDTKAALRKIKTIPEELVCDVLLDQELFAGVGNIIKNEILYRTGIDPNSKTGKIPAAKLKALVKDAVDFAFLFLKYRKVHMLTKHLQVHDKKVCPKHETPLEKGHPGKKKRRSFWCKTCQKLYG
jgi:endonuclease-8